MLVEMVLAVILCRPAAAVEDRLEHFFFPKSVTIHLEPPGGSEGMGALGTALTEKTLAASLM